MKHSPERAARASAGSPSSSTTLDVHVQPRASRSEIVGWHGNSVKVRLRSPPVDGAANEELVRFLAARMGLSPSAIRIVRGTSGRRKRLVCDGVTRAEALRALGLALDETAG